MQGMGQIGDHEGTFFKQELPRTERQNGKGEAKIDHDKNI